MTLESLVFDSARPPRTVEELDEVLSRPSPELIELFGRLPGDLMLLGVGGKMGPTLARMAQRACTAADAPRRIFGVSRFGSPQARETLEKWGIETLSCDLLDERQVARLPDAAQVISLTGLKFGTSSNPAISWAMNCYLPALVCRRFHSSRIVAFSSGNVYGLVPVTGGGSREHDPVRPVGEYAMTVLGRERIYEYFSHELQIPLALLRLNYATELRYGVIVDLAQKVWRGEPIDLRMGAVNVIWQRDANEMALRALEFASAPPQIFNIAGPEILSVRQVATQLAKRLDREPRFENSEAPDALLNNASTSYERLGHPRQPLDTILAWTADWTRRGGESLGKPTHFESRDGAF